MAVPGSLREDLVRSLNAAYVGGLISDETFAARLDQVLNRTVVDPRALVGDLWVRDRGDHLRERISRVVTAISATVSAMFADGVDERLLALDWAVGNQELLVGRGSHCDIVLSDTSVSRRHARLSHRNGCWVLQDLESTNGSYLNGRRVGRCELRPGDRLALGRAFLRVD